MDANRPIVKLKLDVIFKRVFGDENNRRVWTQLRETETINNGCVNSQMC